MIVRSFLNGTHFNDASTAGRPVLCAFVTWVRLLSDDEPLMHINPQREPRASNGSVPQWLRMRLAVNGEPICTAGIPGYSILNCILTWRRPDPETDMNLPIEDRLREDQAHLHLGGAPSSEYWLGHDWINRPIEIGDVVDVDILPPGPCDPAATIEHGCR